MAARDVPPSSDDIWLLEPVAAAPAGRGTKRGREPFRGGGAPALRAPSSSAAPSSVPWQSARHLVADLLRLHAVDVDGGGSGGGAAPAPVAPAPSHSPLLRLHEEVLDFCAFVSPTPSEVAIAGRALAAVHGVLTGLFPGQRVEVFGSRALGLVLPTSDWDLVLPGVQGSRATMRRIAAALEEAGAAKKTEVIDSARVPIVKVWEAASGICVDISFSDAAASGLATRAAMAGLLARFPAARPLTLVLKYFLLQRGLNDTYTGGVGSYLLVLMAVSVVQGALRRARGGGWLGEGGSALNLGTLLASALELYGANLNLGAAGVSVRGGVGGFFPKASRGFLNGERPGLLCMESPADPTQDVGRNSWGIAKVRRCFALAHSALARALRTWGAAAEGGGGGGSSSSSSSSGSSSSSSSSNNSGSGGGSSGGGGGSGSGGGAAISGGGSSGSSGAAPASTASAYGPVFSQPPESILASVIRVDALLLGRLSELRAQKAEAEAAAVGADASDVEGAAADGSGAQQRALDRLEALAGGSAAEGGVQIRHKRLLSDILTRKERGVAAVQPAPDGWY